jgi:hypothetical protein
MAKKVIKKNIHKSKKTVKAVSPFSIYWEKQNYYILFLGFVVIIAGFYLMSIGPWNSTPSLVISPLLLVIGYILIFPASLFLRKKSRENLLQEEKVDTGKS